VKLEEGADADCAAELTAVVSLNVLPSSLPACASDAEPSLGSPSIFFLFISVVVLHGVTKMSTSHSAVLTSCMHKGAETLFATTTCRLQLC
jgi:hypothetical protein